MAALLTTLVCLVLAATAAAPPPRYAVEVSRTGPGGMNVLFDSVHHPETTDFAHNFGPSHVRLLDGVDALVIRSCVHRPGCSTPGNPDVVTLVKRTVTGPVDLSNLQSEFEKNSLDKVILRPQGADEHNATACGPTWPHCSRCCKSTKTKVVMSKTPEVASSWVRVNRTGDVGFDAKSTATLVRDTPPHFQWTGTGSVRSWQSNDLLHWTAAEDAIVGRPGSFDPGYCEAGAPPVRLADGNYFTTYDTIIGSQRHGWAAGWVVLNGSNPREVLQRGGEPLVEPTRPWELQTPPQWNWTQAVQEGGVPMIGATNGLMPLGGDVFLAWACASDSVVEAFEVRVTKW